MLWCICVIKSLKPHRPDKGKANSSTSWSATAATSRFTVPAQLHLPVTTRARPLDARPPVIQIILARLDVVKYPLGNPHKGLLDIFSALGTRLNILQHAVPPRPLLCLFPRHLPLVLLLLRQVRLVAHQDDDDVRLRNLPQVIQPVRHVLKRLSAGEVEDKEGAARTAEVGACDGLVGLLAGRVPEGQLHVLLGRFAGVPGRLGEAIRRAGRCRRPRGGVYGGGEEAGGLGVRRADRDDARAEFHADGDVVMGGEAALTEADG